MLPPARVLSYRGVKALVDRLQDFLYQHPSVLWKIILLLPLLLGYACLAVSYVIVIIFLPAAASFDTVTPFQPTRGYVGSYQQHRSRRRWIGLGACSTTFIIIVLNVLDGLFLVYHPVYGLSTCTISSDTTVDQTYVTNHNCGDIVIAANSKITFSGSIDLGGDANATLTINQGLNVVFDGALDLIDDGDTIVIDGTVTQAPGNLIGVDIEAASATISSTGSITTAGQGCSGGLVGVSDPGYGPSSSACVSGGTGSGRDSATSGGGAGHGGAGGNGSSGASGGQAYDNTTLPQQVGAGGGRAANHVNASGGAGGGRIVLTTTTLTVNGTIKADGASGNIGETVGGGGGAGGTIYLQVRGTLNGTGSLSAKGGAGGNATTDGGGGGGGIIALNYTTLASGATVSNNLTVTGGSGNDNATGGSNGSTITTQYAAPSTPTVTVRTDGDASEARSPYLSASYTANGLAHTSSDWEIATDSSGSNIVWSELATTTDLDNTRVTSAGSFSSDLVGATGLDQHTAYNAFTRQTNAAGSSSWSSASAFTTPNLPPLLTTAIADFSVVANTTTFDVNDYFSDSGDTLSYSVLDDFDPALGTMTMNSDGTVTFNTFSSDPTSDTIQFRATDGAAATVDSNAFTVTVTNGTATSVISYVEGTQHGHGVVSVYNTNDIKIAQWRAFRKGGVIPILNFINDTPYIFTVKRRSGSTMHVYDANGGVLKRKILSPHLHRRQIAIGKIDRDNTSEEIVVTAKRTGRVYFKIFSFNPTHTSFRLLKRAQYAHVMTNRYSITIKDHTVVLRNQRGILFQWKPRITL